MEQNEQNTMVQEGEVTENKMGTQPVGKLLISMSLPMMASMLVQALYNVVDSIFVARVGEAALTAVSLAFPIQSVMIAVGVGSGVGVSALVARALGEKEQDKANTLAKTGIVLAIISYIVFAIVGYLITKPFFYGQTSDTEIINYGIDYLSIVTVFSVGLFMSTMFEKLVQASGRTMITMITQSFGAIVNIILDPIMIFGLLGCPALGVKGAAIATVIGQCCGGTLAIILNAKYNKDIQISFKGFKMESKYVKMIYNVAVPSIVMQSIGSVMVYGLNKILISFSSTATAVFGVYFKLQSFVFMPIFGLNSGMMPIVAYNYGAGRKDRMMQTLKCALGYIITIMAIGVVVMQTMPAALLNMFAASETMLEIGIPALRIISTSFIFAGYCIGVGAMFQSLGRAWYSMIVSVARQLIVLLPVAYLLAQTGSLNMVWLSYPIAEVVSVVATTYFFIKLKKEVIDKMN